MRVISERLSGRRRTWRAFTLVELMVVVVIIGILIGILIPALERSENRPATSRPGRYSER